MIETTSKPIRVLCLDGGGMRGLYTAAVLQNLASRFHQSDIDIGSGFDLIVGTSTGAILASGLAAGVPLSTVVDLYAVEGKSIFTDPMPDLTRKFHLAGWVRRCLTKPANSADHLKAVLTRIFGAETLGALFSRRGIGLCITSVDLLKESARVFKTGHVIDKNRDDALRITDVCLASAAAPVFLPLARIEGSGVFVDGGLWANNPIMVGLVEALEIAGDRSIEIISIGTCPAPAGNIIAKSALNRGLWGWLFNTTTLSVSMNAQAHGSNNIARLLQPHLSKNGRSVTIARLPQTAPSLDHAKYLKLDQASDLAISAFQELGQADAVAAYQLCQNGSQEGRLIRSAFEHMVKRQEAKIHV